MDEVGAPVEVLEPTELEAIEPAEDPPPPIRVQIIDSLAMARRTVRLGLGDQGFDVVIESESGAQALADFRSMRPDVVTVDMTLNDIDGVQLVRQLRRIDPDVRAILLASCDPQAIKREFLHAGACAAIGKPVDPARLAAEIRAAHALLEAPCCHELVATARVLVVDDDPVFRQVARKVLTRADYAVCAEVTDGDEALVAVRRERPDVVLLDINLTGLNGLWALEQIRRIDPRVPVIMVTGARDRATVAKAASLGVQGFLVKPVEPTRLIEQVAAVTGKPPPGQ